MDPTCTTHGHNAPGGRVPPSFAPVSALFTNGDVDEIVPVTENTDVLEARDKALGGKSIGHLTRNRSAFILFASGYRLVFR